MSDDESETSVPPLTPDEPIVTWFLEDHFGPKVHSMEDLRQELRAATRDMEKESALTVERIFHSMETLLLYECTRRDKKLADARLHKVQLEGQIDRMVRQSTEGSLTFRRGST